MRTHPELLPTKTDLIAETALERANPPKKRILRKPQVTEKTGLSSTTIWRLENKGQFPARRILGANSVGWLENEIDDWIESRAVGPGEPVQTIESRLRTSILDRGQEA